jgi:hemerythrin-like domain-containing protein
MRKAKAKAVNAVDLLIEDHDYVRQAFKQFEKIKDKGDKEAVAGLVAQVCQALKVHTRVEEEIFYPAVRRKIAEPDLMFEAEIEHNSAKTLIRQLERMKAGDPRFGPTFTVLCEYVDHHAKEEEKEMFPKARRKKVDMARLGKQIVARKLALEKRAAR